MVFMDEGGWSSGDFTNYTHTHTPCVYVCTCIPERVNYHDCHDLLLGYLDYPSNRADQNAWDLLGQIQNNWYVYCILRHCQLT